MPYYEAICKRTLRPEEKGESYLIYTPISLPLGKTPPHATAFPAGIINQDKLEIFKKMPSDIVSVEITKEISSQEAKAIGGWCGAEFFRKKTEELIAFQDFFEQE